MEVSPRTTFALYLERTATFPPFGTTFHHFLPLMCLSYNIFVEIASGFSEFTKIPDQKNAEFMRLSGFFSPAGGSWRAGGDLPLFPSFFLTESGGNPVIKTSESGNLLVQARQPLAGFIAPAHSMRCSLSVTRQMSARASTVAACRVYRTKKRLGFLCCASRSAENPQSLFEKLSFFFIAAVTSESH